MEIRILHLSDMHGVPGGPSPIARFKAACAAARRASGNPGDRFDVVVISGDLTQQASAAEYVSVRDLLEHVLAGGYLKAPDPWRVVLVPGNHDVDWAWCKAHATPLAKADVRGSAELDGFLDRPHDSMLRVRYDRRSLETDAVRFDAATYNQRLSGFQALVDAWYPSPGGAPHRRLACTGAAREHWSAHVFPEDGLALYGLSSCHGNDSHWTGASLHEEAVAAAAEHADAHARGLIRIAVWHHGLTTSRDAPDFLPIADVGLLKRSDFRLGLHGHTHEDEFRHMNDAFSSAFPILAVGSFGAPDRDRPGGIANQFSVISIYSRRYVLQRIFDLRQNVWEIQKAPRFFDLDAAPPPDPRRTPIARVHRRVVAIDAQGIATNEAIYEGLDLDGKLRIARPRKLAGRQLRADDRPSLPTLAIIPPTETDPAFYLAGTASHADVSWKYRVSNAYAVFPGDTRFREAADVRATQLKPDEDGIAYLARTLTGELVLEMRFPDRAAAARAKGWRVRVEHRAGDGEAWMADAADAEEARRLTAAGTATPEGFAVTVPNPLVGHRYVLVYQLDDPRDDALEDALAAIQQLVPLCRRRLPLGPAPERLARELDDVVRARTPGDGVIPWLCSLWEEESRYLVPAFGCFPTSTWGVRFRHGEGIVGHAFRTRAPVCHPGADPLVYAPRGELAGAYEHAWVAAVPLLLRPDGPAVGALSFVDEGLGDQIAPAAKRLRALAAADARTRDPELVALAHALSRRFWAVATDVLDAESNAAASAVTRRVAEAWG